LKTDRTDDVVARAFQALEIERVWFLAWSARLPGHNSLWLIVVCAALAVLAIVFSGPEIGLEHQRGRLERLAPFTALWAVAIYGSAVPLFVGSARHTFDRLRDHLRGTPEEIEAWAASLSHYRGRGLLVLTILCLSAGIGVQELNSSRWSRVVSGDWQEFDLFSGALAIVALVVWPQSLFLLIYTARALRRAVTSAWDPPLFDDRCGRPLFRFGLNAVLLATAGNIVIALLLSPSAREDSLTAGLSVLAVCGINLASGVGVLLFPTLVWRNKRRAKKARELALVQRAIDGDRAALGESEMTGQIADYELLQLIAYRREVEALSDFPFTASHAGRLTFYMLLPPISWIAAALAERLVDRLLG
jgi:hypothetical protein